MVQATLLLGDALVLRPEKTAGVAVISDPPYGCRNNCNYQRFTRGKLPHRDFDEGIAGDDRPFDPTPWLAYPQVILWGYQFFAAALPPGTVLVWNKRREKKLGKFLSDCELAWQKGGKGCYLFNHVWDGFDRASERGQKSLHPSQKPVALMRWCIARLKLPPGTLILDPYMGSGATGVAAMQLGYDFIGIEINQSYFATAQKRIGEAQFIRQATAPEGQERFVV